MKADHELLLNGKFGFASATIELPKNFHVVDVKELEERYFRPAVYQLIQKYQYLAAVPDAK